MLVYPEAPDASLGIYPFGGGGLQSAIFRPSKEITLALDGLKRRFPPLAQGLLWGDFKPLNFFRFWPEALEVLREVADQMKAHTESF